MGLELVTDQVVHLIDDQNALAQVERTRDHATQEHLVDARLEVMAKEREGCRGGTVSTRWGEPLRRGSWSHLEAVYDLCIWVHEVLATLDAEPLVERRVGGVVALKESLVVLEHMHLERMEKVAEKVDSWGRENEKLKGQW